MTSPVAMAERCLAVAEELVASGAPHPDTDERMAEAMNAVVLSQPQSAEDALALIWMGTANLTGITETLVAGLPVDGEALVRVAHVLDGVAAFIQSRAGIGAGECLGALPMALRPQDLN